MTKPVVLIAEELSPATIDALGPDFDVRNVDGTDRPALLSALVAVQVTLGAATVLSGLEVWTNSAHLVCGALVLATSLVLTLRAWRVKFADSAAERGIHLPRGERRDSPARNPAGAQA